MRNRDSGFLAGHHRVILDVTYATEKRRKDWKSESGNWGCSYVPFKPSPETCITWAKADGRPELIPVIERMAESIEWDFHKEE